MRARLRVTALLLAVGYVWIRYPAATATALLVMLVASMMTLGIVTMTGGAKRKKRSP